MLPSQQWQFKMEIPTTLKENSCVRPYWGSRYLLYTFKMLIIMTWAPEVAFWDASPGNNSPARVVGSLNENCRWISQSDSFHQGTSSKQDFQYFDYIIFKTNNGCDYASKGALQNCQFCVSKRDLSRYLILFWKTDRLQFFTSGHWMWVSRQKLYFRYWNW